MGNRIDIFPTRFVDVDLKGNELEANYGLRVCDDNDMTYTNGLPKDEIVGRSPAEIVELARRIDDRARDMIAFAEDAQDGIYIAGEFFAWTDLKSGTPRP